MERGGEGQERVMGRRGEGEGESDGEGGRGAGEGLTIDLGVGSHNTGTLVTWRGRGLHTAVKGGTLWTMLETAFLSTQNLLLILSRHIRDLSLEMPEIKGLA